MGNSVDQATLIIAALVVGLKIVWRFVSSQRPYFDPSEAVRDLLNGALIVPFGVMVVQLFAIDVYKYMAQNSSVFVALAGIIGLLFVWNEIKPAMRGGR